jgi:polysaccharide deacetylase family protein (PEP-CTERM system associated)
MSPSPHHLFSVDLEDWYHVSAFDAHVARARWGEMPVRVNESTAILLDLLDAAGHTATFFVLGWVADRHPNLVREVHRRGHEIASHTWWHHRVYSQAPEDFRRDVTTAKAQLEDLVGAPVVGFRAPSFSITPEAAWAYEVLVETGHAYDSSVFPIRRPGYGNPGAPLAPHVIATPSGPLREYPLATTGLGPLRLPGAGGAYLRHLPLALVRRAIREAEAAARPAMLYVHPWEVDPGQPRLPVGGLTTLRHYGGLARMAPRLASLFAAHAFMSVARWEAARDAAGRHPARLASDPLPVAGPAS